MARRLAAIAQIARVEADECREMAAIVSNVLERPGGSCANIFGHTIRIGRRPQSIRWDHYDDTLGRDGARHEGVVAPIALAPAATMHEDKNGIADARARTPVLGSTAAFAGAASKITAGTVQATIFRTSLTTLRGVRVPANRRARGYERTAGADPVPTRDNGRDHRPGQAPWLYLPVQ